MIDVVPASPAHVGTLAARMREIDRRECAAMGHSPKQALRLCLQFSTFVWTARLDGRPEAMFGADTVSVLDGIGSPWLLMTDTAAQQKKALVRMGRSVTALLQAEFAVLRNNVHADNTLAIEWLRRLGYEIGPSFDMGGQEMRPFSRERSECANQELSPWLQRRCKLPERSSAA